jgi:hypothetical protein
MHVWNDVVKRPLSLTYDLHPFTQSIERAVLERPIVLGRRHAQHKDSIGSSMIDDEVSYVCHTMSY